MGEVGALMVLLRKASTWTILLVFVGLFFSGSQWVGAELLEAQLLRVGRELKGETLMAPGSKTYVLSKDGMFPDEAVDIRISYLSIPPAKFSFSVSSYLDDGSVQIKRRAKRPYLRQRRRRLDTAITTITTGKSGLILLNGKESQRTILTVTAVPTGVKPGGEGLEKSVEVRFNIIMERKIINNSIPETASRMIAFGILSLFVSAIVVVPILSSALRKGDDIITRNTNGDEKRDS